MPTISSFYGIIIFMHVTRKEHLPPHIHARYGGKEASFLIENGEVYSGMFPGKGKQLVKEFVLMHKAELQKNVGYRGLQEIATSRLAL